MRVQLGRFLEACALLCIAVFCLLRSMILSSQVIAECLKVVGRMHN